MHIYNDGYAGKYASEKVRGFACKVAKAIPALMAKTGAEAVVVTGMSGATIGHAALMLADFPLVLVRKESDNSHGRPIEGPMDLVFHKYILLDDFVSSGATARRVLERLKSHDEAVECVGILEYNTLSASCPVDNMVCFDVDNFQ